MQCRASQSPFTFFVFVLLVAVWETHHVTEIFTHTIVHILNPSKRHAVEYIQSTVDVG